MVEERSGGQPKAGGGGEGGAQFGEHQGAEAQLAEGGTRGDGLVGRVGQDGPDLCVDEIAYGSFAVRGGQTGQAGAELTAWAVLSGGVLGVDVGGRPGCRGGRRRAGAAGGVQPVVPALEGVGGQVDPASAPRLVQRAPVDVGAMDEHGGQRGQQGLGLGSLTAQHGNGRGRVGVAEAVVGERGQDAVGSDLDEGRDALGLQSADAVGEADGLPDVPDPVAGRGQFPLVGECAGDVGDHGDGRGVVGEPGGRVVELLQDVVHVRRVEGMADGEPRGLAALRAQPLGDGLRRLGVTGDHRGVRGVDGGDGHLLLVAREKGRDLVLRGLHGDHDAAGDGGLHQTGAGGDQRGGVGQVEDSGHMSGRDLAHGVARHIVRADAEGLQEPEKGHLHGEQGGLRVGRLVQAVTGAHGVGHRSVQIRVEGGGHLVERGRVDGEVLVEPLGHADVLSTLSGEQEGRTALTDAAGDHGGRGGVLGQGRGAREQAGPVGCEDDGAMAQGGPGAGQGPAHVDGRGVGGDDVGVQAVRLGA